MVTLDDLRCIKILEGLEVDSLSEIPLGEERWLEPDDKLFRQGDTPKNFYFLLDGLILLTQNAGHQDLKVMVYDRGSTFGEVALLAGTPHLATATAINRVRVMALDVEVFWNIIGECKILRQRILQNMAERATELQSVTYQREKLLALGSLASGLAHELNNPSAAAARAAEQLADPAFHLSRTALMCVAQGMTKEQSDHLWALRECVQAAPKAESPIQAMDRETELCTWLASQDVPDPWQKGAALAACGLQMSELEILAGPHLAPAVDWLDATLSIHQITRQLHDTTSHITKLVNTVKGYTHMDQAPIGEVDIHQGLDSTLAVLSHKISLAHVKVVKNYAPDLPFILGQGGQLNQVWTALIDNAVEALQGVQEPTLTVSTMRFQDVVKVEIRDNGPGIPVPIRQRIFEPFFSTKSVGSGTGLGLELAYRIVAGGHGGDLRLYKGDPGDTRFKAMLPIRPGRRELVGEEVAEAAGAGVS